MVELKKTPLNAQHRSLGAKMVDFGGWDMPVHYTSILAEHEAVRTQAGLFDVSHMGEIWVEGPEALGLIQRISSNDASRLAPGQIQYTGLLTRKGCFVDDMLVYKGAEDRYLLVVNASNEPKDHAWIEEESSGFNVGVANRSTETAQLAIQGPKAEAILQPLVGDLDLQTIGYYRFDYGTIVGRKALFSRTGYTGENGFEIYIEPGAAQGLWRAIMESGAGFNIGPVGLGARDTLRLEMGFPLGGHELDRKSVV